MVPSLSTGAISKILSEEDVPYAVIQILGCQKISHGGNDRYRLLISDGITWYSHATLGTPLNQMVANKELEKFTVIRVDRLVCYEVQANIKVIFLLSLTVLVPGKEINETLGNPTNSNGVPPPAENGMNGTAQPSSKPLFQSDRNPTLQESPASDNGAPTTNPMKTSPSQSKWQVKIMVPSLTTGCINKILSGEDVPNAVIQILGCKKINGGKDIYRFMISDGITWYSYATLGTQLNQMVANKELEKFTVIRVDRCVCNQVQADRKVIFLLSLTVLVPGKEINKRLGNPTSSNAVTPAENPSDNGMNGTAQLSSKPLSDRNPALQESPASDNGAPTTNPMKTSSPSRGRWEEKTVGPIALTKGSIKKNFEWQRCAQCSHSDSEHQEMSWLFRKK